MTTESSRACHHDLLSDLTRQHGADGLIDSLQSGLQQLLPDSPFRLYFRAGRDPLASLALLHGDYDNQDQSLLQRLEQEMQTVQTAQDESDAPLRTALPIPLNGRLYGALIIEGEADTQNPALQTLLTIFSNQLALLKASNCDALTGLYNRQAFDTRINRLLARMGNSQRRASDTPAQIFFALLDIDNFKQINDRFGHLFGDEVLLHFAQQMQQSFRDDDLLFRYGGEEFVVILSTPDPLTAGRVLDRFRQRIEEYHFPQVGQVTVSTGYTQMKKNQLLPVITGQADRALYYAKSQGRNQTRHYEQLLAEGLLEPNDDSGAVELF